MAVKIRKVLLGDYDERTNSKRYTTFEVVDAWDLVNARNLDGYEQVELDFEERSNGCIYFRLGYKSGDIGYACVDEEEWFEVKNEYEEDDYYGIH